MEKKIELSHDYLLNKKLCLAQPLEGHRFGTDAVWLAAATCPQERRPKAEVSVLEVGCGVGAALFCLGWRRPEVRLTGLEREELLLRIAQKNAEANGFAAKTRLVLGDLFDKSLGEGMPKDLGDSVSDCSGKLLRGLVPQSFDHVMTNPPFVDAGQTRSSSDLKARAYHEDTGTDLKAWMRGCGGASNT